MKNLKITIIGNSVGLRVRPPKKYPNNKNYGQIIVEMLNKKIPDHNVYVMNLSIHRALVHEILNQVDDFIRTFPDYFIINLGVCDAATREVPLWFSNQVSRKKQGMIHFLISLLYFNVINKIRPPLVKLRNYKSWTHINSFASDYQKLLFKLHKETNARIITMPINKTTDRVEEQLPGSRKNFEDYSDVIKEKTLAGSFNFLDLNDLLPEQHCPDGIHFSHAGHNFIAEKITKIILKDNML